MSSLEDIRNARLRKLTILAGQGIDSYPVEATHELPFTTVLKRFATFKKRSSMTLSGRVMAIRRQGGLVFFDLDDGTARLQGMLKRDQMPQELFRLWDEAVDIGDIVEVTGALFTTKRTEHSIAVSRWRMLAKALRPLPEKWSGLTDVEERFRKRYLDTLMNTEVRQRFILRSRVVRELRRMLEREGFLEVETSMLQPIPGGGNAEPFVTHHNYLDLDLHLRIAPEIDLKKLLIGGYPKVYEIGRSFRNEAIDATHNPEFTTIEWYEAWSDAAKQRAFVEKLLRTLVKRVTGRTTVTFRGDRVDFGKNFTVITFDESLERYALITHPNSIPHEELHLKARRLGVTAGPADMKEKLLDGIYKRAVRPKIIQPTFIIDYPPHLIPLAKRKTGDKNVVDAFQLVAGGLELVKAFSELNDPADQRERFEEQQRRRTAGDKETELKDESFLEALEYGMPPAGGVGMGIERLLMLLTDSHNIREVIFFPTLRQKPKKE